MRAQGVETRVLTSNAFLYGNASTPFIEEVVLFKTEKRHLVIGTENQFSAMTCNMQLVLVSCRGVTIECICGLLSIKQKYIIPDLLSSRSNKNILLLAMEKSSSCW